jgi:hypothetical protein
MPLDRSAVRDEKPTVRSKAFSKCTPKQSQYMQAIHKLRLRCCVYGLRAKRDVSGMRRPLLLKVGLDASYRS